MRNKGTFSNTKHFDDDNSYFKVDELDLKLADLLLQGERNNKEIAKKVNTPLSTIERRTRLIFKKRVLDMKADLNYGKLGLKKAFINICLMGANNPASIAEAISKIKCVVSVSITIGNSDLLCIVTYTDSEELYRIIAAMKSTHGVSRVWWSEEVYNISGKNYSISSLIQVPKNKSDIMSSSYH